MVKTSTRKMKTEKAAVLESAKVLLPFFLFFTLLTYLVKNNSFFWDSIVVGSAYANWFYETNFSLFVPEAIAGYPPLFGMYLAFGWKLLGRTLPVSHFLMLPFLVGIVWQLHVLIRRFVKPRYQLWVLLLILLEPVFLAQAVQIAPDIPLVFLYLMALNAICRNSKNYLILATILLTILSPRGSIMVGGLFLTSLGLQYFKHGSKLLFKSIVNNLLLYVPAAIVTVTWLWLHYNQYGWVLYNTASEWGEGAAAVDINEFLRNLVVIGWRFADFGKIVPYIILFFLLFKTYKQSKFTLEIKQLLWMCFAPFLVLSLVLVWFQNPIGHRYYMVVYMLSLLLFGYLILEYEKKAVSKALYVLTAIFLMIGHYAVFLYPSHFAKGWDATLAHLPYYSLRTEMLTYLNKNDIPISSVGSAYPNLRPLKLIDLGTDQSSFKTKNFEEQEYILHSNVFNDFTTHELNELHQYWKLQHEVRKSGIFLRLYQKQ